MNASMKLDLILVALLGATSMCWYFQPQPAKYLGHIQMLPQEICKPIYRLALILLLALYGSCPMLSLPRLYLDEQGRQELGRIKNSVQVRAPKSPLLHDDSFICGQ